MNVNGEQESRYNFSNLIKSGSLEFMLKTHSNFLRLPKGAGLTVLQVDLLSRLVSYLNNAPARREDRIIGTLERLLDLERIGREKIERRKRIEKIENNQSGSLFSLFSTRNGIPVDGDPLGLLKD